MHKRLKLPAKHGAFNAENQARVTLNNGNGALGRIRTPGPLIRSQVLYPTELPAPVERVLAPPPMLCKCNSPLKFVFRRESEFTRIVTHYGL